MLTFMLTFTLYSCLIDLPMKTKDTKHLQLRGNVWWLYYKIPKHLKSLPQFEYSSAIYTESLKTDGIVKARRLRDAIIHNLNDIPKNPHEAWDKEIINRSKEFTSNNPHLDERPSYKDLLLDDILDQAREQSGIDSFTGDPKGLTEEQQVKLDVIAEKMPEHNKGLKHLTEKVVEERAVLKQAPKTVLKIKRSADWFLEHILQDDINIASIDYDQVHNFVVQDLKSGSASSTISGHLYGLRQIWKRAKQSKLVSGDNPFNSHGIKKEQNSYDPFTYDEIYQLYSAADGDLKILIHAAATTGARISELLTADVKTPSSFNKPCWLFMFKDKGKTSQSTRAVPIHPSLNLPEGFSFRSLANRTVTKQFKQLRESCITDSVHELTGKPRKLSFHSFRTTVITELTVKHRINEKVVGAITGHLAGNSRVGSIRTYINPNDLRALLETVSLLPWDYK